MMAKLWGKPRVVMEVTKRWVAFDRLQVDYMYATHRRCEIADLYPDGVEERS